MNTQAPRKNGFHLASTVCAPPPTPQAQTNLENLRVLIVDDSADEAALVLRELRRAYNTDCEIADNILAFCVALENRQWDLVISNYHKFPWAFEALRKKTQNIPFIVVSEDDGANYAETIMKNGAHDYIAKDNLTRLIPSVRRELWLMKIGQKRPKW